MHYGNKTFLNKCTVNARMPCLFIIFSVHDFLCTVWPCYYKVQRKITLCNVYSELSSSSARTNKSLGWHIVGNFSKCRPEEKCKVAQCPKIDKSDCVIIGLYCIMLFAVRC